jgi:uncharacterized protein with NRDE domain
MCTIAFLIDVIAGAPLVIAANRDELYARPTRPPERLGNGIAGGVDALSGGTWLAVRADGQFAAVTNQRALATPPPGLRSRGLAVKELAAARDPDAYVAALDPTRYASMNLAWGDARGVSIAYARQDTGAKDIVRLGRGVHVLCNDRLGAPGFPRCERLTATVDALVHGGAAWPDVQPRLVAALADHTRVPLADVPPSHLAPELARELTCACIHSDAYGTRSSTIFAAAHGRALAYLHADGPPCTTPFVDRRALLEMS